MDLLIRWAATLVTYAGGPAFACMITNPWQGCMASAARQRCVPEPQKRREILRRAEALLRMTKRGGGAMVVKIKFPPKRSWKQSARAG